MTNYSRLIELVERLVAYRTDTGNVQAARECLLYTERPMTVSGMHIDRYNCNGFESLVATTRPTKHPKLMLQAHLDVVPADESMYALRRQDGRLIGRGTFDMKYAAACYLKIIEDLRDDLADYNLGIMFTTDEEFSGQDGVGYLMEQGYGCDIAIIPDGGDNWRLESAAKGNWMVEVTAIGKTAHGSRPWEGSNAIEKLMIFLQAAKDTTEYKEHTDTTLTISTVQAGTATNQVPEKATATLDIRYLTRPDYEAVHEKIRRLAAGSNVQLRTLHFIPSIELDVTHPLVQTWEDTVREVRGNTGDGYALSFGASDARYFAAKGIPTIVTRPDGGGHHGAHEWIDESGLYEFYECLKQYVVRTARMPADKLDP